MTDADLDFTDHSAPYITGNGFASRCGHYFTWGKLGKNPTRDNDVTYCKTDDVPALFEWLDRKLAAFPPFTLLTHNSDLAITAEHLHYLDDPRVHLWLAQNPAVAHPKLKALPIGIANRQWPHGDVAALERVQAEVSYRTNKTSYFYANYSIKTDTDGERLRCYAATRSTVELAESKPFENYLRELAGALFCISPRGRGIDAHRTWEALAVGTIPVVTKSLVTRHHDDFPLVTLPDWSAFRDYVGLLTPELALRMWVKFDAKLLTMDGYCSRLRERYGVEL